MRTAATSIDAFQAHHTSGKAADQHGLILAFITSHGGDWSIGEIAKAMNLEKSTVSGRLRELLDDGALVELPKRKDRVSGVTIRPVGLPTIGQQELFQQWAQ